MKFLLVVEHYCLDSMASYQFGHMKEMFERPVTVKWKRICYFNVECGECTKQELTSADIFPVGDMSMKFPIFMPDCCCEAGEKFIFGLDGGNRDE